MILFVFLLSRLRRNTTQPKFYVQTEKERNGNFMVCQTTALWIFLNLTYSITSIRTVCFVYRVRKFDLIVKILSTYKNIIYINRKCSA